MKFDVWLKTAAADVAKVLTSNPIAKGLESVAITIDPALAPAVAVVNSVATTLEVDIADVGTLYAKFQAANPPGTPILAEVTSGLTMIWQAMPASATAALSLPGAIATATQIENSVLAAVAAFKAL